MSDALGLEGLLTFTVSTTDVLRNLLVALLCGLLIAVFYVGATGRFTRSRTFLNSLVALAMITTIVIMVIGNNLARAFGLVGAMSIIRFRTAVKDVQDIIFIFFSLTIGMAAGVGLSRVAIFGTIFVGSVMVALAHVHLPGTGRREYVLQFSHVPSDGPPPHLKVLERHFSRFHLVNAASGEPGQPVQLAYYVHIRRRGDVHAALEALRAVEGVSGVNLLYDESAG